MTKKIRLIGFSLLAVLWAVLVLSGLLSAPQETSVSERRKLAQFPVISMNSILDGEFMEDFESYSLDQFPLRDTFRRIKALVHYNVLMQGDNNSIYVADGYAAKLEYPLNEASAANALDKFNHIYTKYLQETDCRIYAAVVPDKGFYLANAHGYPAMDYEGLFSRMETGMSWAETVDLTDCLSISDYYRTDTHWRQEKLLPAARRLCEAMGTAAFSEEELTATALERPFYGVYYGQAALPMEPETMYLLENDLLAGCTVHNYETGKASQIYDEEKLHSRDLYDVYLSGAAALLDIFNPAATSEKSLVVFRDSFGSSLIPLLIKDYRTVTVVDTRYIAADLLAQYLEFTDQDVLFLYSTLILNSSNSLK